MLSNKEFMEKFKGLGNNTWFYILIITYVLFWIFKNPGIIHFAFVLTIIMIYVEKFMLVMNGKF